MQASLDFAGASPPSLTTRLVGAVRRYLPRGDTLPEAAWHPRQRATLMLLWLHVAVLPIVGNVTGSSLYHSLWESGIVALAAIVGTSTRFNRTIRMLAVTFGLITSSALLVHFSGGLIEMHFHFFVMVAVITLYQAWLPFLMALGYVVIHHGMMGALDPLSVYNHPAALNSPWKWALVHGFFILGESAALLVVWRLNENSRAEAESSYQQQLDEEHARLEAQEKYREIFDNAVEGIYEVDMTDGSIIVNPAIAFMLGYSSVDELLSSGIDLFQMQVDPTSEAELLGLLQINDEVHDFEYQVRRKDGTLRWVSNNAHAVRDSDGGMIGVQGTVEDITERKHNEELLKEREEQFRILFESNPLPMWVYDIDTLRFLAVNHAAITHYGYSTDEFMQMTIAEIRPREDVPALMEDVGKGRSVLQHSGPWRHVRKDRSVREVDIKSHTLDFEGRRAALVVVDDVTERNFAERQREKLERQLRQAQKMEAVGQLAGGIAHDFNNILSVIINYASLMKEDFDPEDSRFEDLEEIRTAGERGANLVRQILAFSRKEIVNPEVLCLNRVVSDMERLLRRTIGEDLDLDLKLGDDLWPVAFDPGHVEQILINLAVNARDAMPHGGKLAIGTSNAALDVSVTENHPEMTAGEYVCLTVSDSGAGMSEEVRNRIFEPFFTTKPIGEGTGLGLAMVYGIVKQSGGYVYAYSEPGVGSTFRIYLPAVRDAEVGEMRAPKPGTSHGGSETVLLVEDEPAVRELARRILSRAGYSVVPAAGGTEAVQAYEATDDHIDLLLTDVIMPGMSGKELSTRLREESGNGLKTLFMSGYTDEIIAERGLLHSGEELIQKPFTADGLLNKVREVLDR